MSNPFDLAGKKILITGASSGIGRAIAILVSQLGAKGILIARRKNELDITATMMNGSAACYCYDLYNTVGIGSLISEIISKHGPMDGFVHSAGVTSTIALRAIKMSMLDKSMRINLYSFLEITKHLSKKGSFNEHMSIVGISSTSALQGNTGKTIYCATKAALDASIRCLAKELAQKKIRVNSVAPGLIHTAIYDQSIGRVENSANIQNIISRQYLGVGEPSDVANMVAYLLSHAAKFITGTSIPLDGGRLSS